MQDDKAQRLQGKSKVNVRIWTFREAEVESKSEWVENGAQSSMEGPPQQPKPIAKG